MDDSDIVVLDDSTEEQPSTSRNVFSIASPAVCQRWTQPSPAQPPMRQRTSHTTWHKTFNPPFDYQPQPVITSVTSLSPSRNRPIIISDVKSLSPKKPVILNGYEPSYQRTKRSSSSYRISQPIITHVESLSPLKNQQSIVGNGSVSVSRQNNEPECIVLDDDDGNINLNGFHIDAAIDFNSVEIEDLKTESSDTLQVGCESNLSLTACQSMSAENDPAEEKPTPIESCEKMVTRDTSDISNPDTNNTTTNPTTSRKRIRPTSVSKKDDPPVADAATILQEFKNACLAAADNEFDMKAILDKKVEKSFNNTSQAFKKTSSFHTLLSNKLQKVKTDPTNVYVHISELVTELKARKASKEEGEEPPTKKIKSSSKVSKNVDYDALENARDEMKMKKLSKTLSILQKHIKKLEQKEVDWEDDSDSAYIILQRYKQRAVKVFQKLCDYTKESKSAGNLNKIHLSKGTCFPKVNKCVENFVNKTGQFPDFVDILELMKESNEKDNMKLQEYEIEDMAKKVFEEVGGELQKQRKHGVADSLLVFMEDEKGDPAEDSTELKEKLNENAKHWTKINEIIDDFAMRAKEKKGNETESKSDDDEEEEEEEEDDDDAEAESGKEDLEEIDVPDILKGENEIDSEKSDNEEEESRDLEEEPVPADCS